MTSAHGSNQHLLGEFTADGHPGATNRADQISAACDLADLQLFAKSEIPQPLTSRPAENTDLHVAAHLGLIQGHGTVDFQIGGKRV